MKKIITLALIGFAGMSSFVNVQALETGEVVDGTGVTPIELTTSAATFNVTVPTALPIAVDTLGVASYATSAKITNYSHGAVEVKKIEVEAKNDWSLVKYDLDSVSSMKVDASEIGLSIFDYETTGLSNNREVFNVENETLIMTGKDVNSDEDELIIQYSASVAPQSAQITDLNVADVVFTIGWDAE